jgi:hypothetical protein
MIGKIIGAVAGAQAAKATRGMDGTTGAVLGALAVPVARRMKVPALLALAAGGYAFKRLSDKGAEARQGPRTE